MQVAVIATDPSIVPYLSAAGFSAMKLDPSDVPSLTGLLFDHPDITALVIQDSETGWWSAPHILSAAKQLESKGPTILLGRGKLTQLCSSTKLVQGIERKEQLPETLRRPPKMSDGGRSLGGADRRAAAERPAPSPPKPVRPRPMNIPPGKILMLGVIGSQSRIGCTTQAIGLWHYCKTLGFDPAVVSSPERISQIAGVMNCSQIDGGYQIEGIPFVADTALAYDCYILDIGTGSIPDALHATDYLVLVAGSKPWELQHTAAALRAARGKRMGILLSFTSQRDAQSLQPLFGNQSAAVVPWVTDLWQPSLEALLVYDSLMRSVLEKIMTIDELTPVRQLHDDPEFTKEGN